MTLRAKLDAAGKPYCCVCVSLDCKRTSVGTYYCRACAEDCARWLASRVAEERAAS